MFNIVPMIGEHIAEVVQVEEECFAITWTKADFEREVYENKLAVYRVALSEEGRVMGYAGMWHVVTEGHITNIAVKPEYRKMGVGSALVQEFLKIGEEKEMIGITLEVRLSNLTAQRLYSRFGFRPEGIRKRYYDDNKEDAIIMWKYFQQGEAEEKE